MRANSVSSRRSKSFICMENAYLNWSTWRRRALRLGGHAARFAIVQLVR
jgi:hypothetical protein